MSNGDDFYGPQLPPQLSQSNEPKKSSCGPELPPVIKGKSYEKSIIAPCGPELPPVIKGKSYEKSIIAPCGPELPLVIKGKSYKKSIAPCGPELPPNFISSNLDSAGQAVSGNYGPELPPASSSSMSYGPDLPPCSYQDNKNVCGPALPPDFNIKNITTDLYGPQLPPKTITLSYGPQVPTKEFKDDTVAYSPALPPGYKTENIQISSSSHESDVYGPVMPPGFQRSEVKSTSEDEYAGNIYDTIGPLVPGAELEEELRHWKNEASTSGGKSAGAGLSGLKRESWMTELPTPSKEVLGLQARKFRTNVTPVDAAGRQAWLATPGEEPNSQLDVDQGFDKQREEFYRKEANSRDAHMADQVESYNKKHKRGESLMDIHNKKRRKKEEKKKKKEKKKKRSRSRSFSPTRAMPRRQPFDRDQDLRVNMMDNASKKAFIAHSRSLSSKFASGEQKYL